ncbi:MAG: hypothetical protein AAGA80_14185 [Cyanobacteria bacterium P01_F01_bin.143]
MSKAIPTPEKIWVITGENSTTETRPQQDSVTRGGSRDTGGFLGGDSSEDSESNRKSVDVDKLKREMKGFLQVMREMLDEADTPDSKMQLDEVELSVEINGEGQVSLFGVGGKAGGKGGMTFKFKRK